MAVVRVATFGPRALSAVGLLFLTACEHDPAAVPSPPVIGVATVTPIPENVLGALVHVRAKRADSIVVRYALADAPPGTDSVTPAVTVAGDSAAAPVLGLLPEQRYLLHAVAYGPGGSVTGKPVSFTTAALPFDLPFYSTAGDNPTPGYTVLAGGRYGIVIDNAGRVVWYRRFPDGPGLNFMVQPNGRYTARPSTPDPSDIERWIEVDPLGAVTRTFGCAHNLIARFHDLLVEPDGGFWIMCDETRVLDLTAYGGAPAARVTGTAIQHIDAGGTLRFEWSPFDHFEITDLPLAERAGLSVNWTHGNAIDLDAEGALYVSLRNLNVVAKIDTRTGAVLWRLGGARSQLALTGGAAPFHQQHGVRVLAPDRILLLDNLGDPFESRGERWEIDAAGSTARVMRSYGVLPVARTATGGSVQPLPNGRVLVAFATAGRLAEFDADGRIVWQLLGNPGYVFRAQRIRSLYQPGVGTAR